MGKLLNVYPSQAATVSCESTTVLEKVVITVSLLFKSSIRTYHGGYLGSARQGKYSDPGQCAH